jgi:hypothetical protein
MNADSHVKARNALVASIARNRECKATGVMSVRREAAAIALAAYEWPSGWGECMRWTYNQDGTRNQVVCVGVLKTIPAIVIRVIARTAK